MTKTELRTYRVSGRRCDADLDLDEATFRQMLARAAASGTERRERVFERWTSCASVIVDATTNDARTEFERITEATVAAPHLLTARVERYEPRRAAAATGSCVAREFVRETCFGDVAVFQEVRTPLTETLRIAYVRCGADDAPEWFVAASKNDAH